MTLTLLLAAATPPQFTLRHWFATVLVCACMFGYLRWDYLTTDTSTIGNWDCGTHTTTSGMEDGKAWEKQCHCHGGLSTIRGFSEDQRMTCRQCGTAWKVVDYEF